MDVKILVGVIIAVFGAIGGCYLFVFKHILKRDKHPCSSKLVYKDVCEKTQDCLEGEIKNVNKRLDELKGDLSKRFDRVEQLIINGGA